MPKDDDRAVQALAENACPLGSAASDLDGLLAAVEGADFVLLGEATHGTREFYQLRCTITRRLVEEQGFDAVAVEADWPDAQRLNRFVRGISEEHPREAFSDFQRFPTWMWRNTDVLALVEWMRSHNEGRGAAAVGFYGIDLYSLYRSAEAVTEYLARRDPEAAERARRAYACLDHVREPQEYGFEAARGMRPDCGEAVRGLFERLEQERPHATGTGWSAADEHFHAEMNARLVANAERYYRSMYSRRGNTWNLRDEHMTDTVLALRDHLRATGRRGRVVVWAHNSHLGDARATEMGRQGEWNVGQLLRERAGTAAVYSVGFTTHTGHVTAAEDWGEPALHRWVRPSRPDSWEHLLHRTGLPAFWLPTAEVPAEVIGEERLERAIGVIYRPDTERQSHYFGASLGRQFDSIIHADETTAVEPLDITEHWEQREAPETWPTGL